MKTFILSSDRDSTRNNQKKIKKSFEIAQ